MRALGFLMGWILTPTAYRSVIHDGNAWKSNCWVEIGRGLSNCCDLEILSSESWKGVVRNRKRDFIHFFRGNCLLLSSVTDSEWSAQCEADKLYCAIRRTQVTLCRDPTLEQFVWMRIEANAASLSVQWADFRFVDLQVAKAFARRTRCCGHKDAETELSMAEPQCAVFYFTFFIVEASLCNDRK